MRARDAVVAPGPEAWLSSLLGLLQGRSLALACLLLGRTGPTLSSQLPPCST